MTTVITAPLLSMWVVYDRPRDFPEHVVVRELRVGGGQVVFQSEARLFPSIDAARAYLEPSGLTHIPRDPNDDPVIVETWL